MRYIIAFKLKRKNARRREYSRFDAESDIQAKGQFDSYMLMREKEAKDLNKQTWELLTGDWRHLSYWCRECKKGTGNQCYGCKFYKEMAGEDYETIEKG